MSPRDLSTPDLFALAPSQPMDVEWPAAARFPLNQDSAKVEDTLLRDLQESNSSLFVVGYSTLDRLIDFISNAKETADIRVVFGTEPFPSKSETFSLIGQEIPQEMKSYWLEHGISVLLSGRLLKCIERLRSNSVRTRYVARSRWRLHAKIYVGDKAATLGSSNFTDPGLRDQLEANTRFTLNEQPRSPAEREENKRYIETKNIAEGFWTLGRDFNDELIELLRQLLRPVTWQEALAKASAELLEAEWAHKYLRGEYLPDDAGLWPSQRQGVAQALYILKERGSVLVADATGSGKTKTGMHLIGAKVHEIISSNRLRRGKAVLICPPSVTSEWERESALASVPLQVYSHGALSWVKDGNKGDSLILDLRRAQVLCVDEGHNFLNFASNRTQQLMRNMADHVALFTATPINRSATDLLRIADMLGADNLDQTTIDAFGRMLGARSISRSLSTDEVKELRREIAKFTVRRTKRVLNQLIDKEPAAYVDSQGRQCRFPTHTASVYELCESLGDRKKAARIRELASGLKGLIFFQKPISLPPSMRKRGVTEEAFLQGRLNAASKLSEYFVMSALRSSRAALLEHLLGTRVAKDWASLEKFNKAAKSGNVITRLDKLSGNIPESKLSIPLPDWLTDAKTHREACDCERDIYLEIAELGRAISDQREQAKAEKLYELVSEYPHVLAFDSRPITLAVIGSLLREKSDEIRVLIATGDTQSDRTELLRLFHPESKSDLATVGLCSDSVSEGVNLQRAQALVHLDMPSVVRIAEQRSGRIDRLNSPHKTIYAWWPSDAEEFALRTDDRFIERYETVDNLLGSNMPLPDSLGAVASTYSAVDAIKEYETNGDAWDGIEDAFSPVRMLISGDNALISRQTYDEYLGITAKIVSRVSIVSAVTPWAFFCLKDSSDVPRWIFLAGTDAEPVTDLAIVCEALRERLGSDVQDLPPGSPGVERVLSEFLDRLGMAERNLLARRKRRALDEMEIVVEAYLEPAVSRQDQKTVDLLQALLQLLRGPPSGLQPDWEEVAARWLDLIRPIWYEKLTLSGRTKPLLLKDIRADLIAAERTLLPDLLREFTSVFPAQTSPEERVVACVIGVGPPAK